MSDNNKGEKLVATTSITSEVEDKLSSVGNTNTNSNDNYISKFLDLSNEAKAEDKRDKHMTLLEGIRTFPKAIGWSVVLSTALVMEGYDLNLITSFFAFPGFTQKFGQYYPELDEYQIPAKWQTGISMSYQCSQIIGLYLAGIFADKIGYRKVLMTTLSAINGLIFIQFFAPNIEVLLVAYVLLGLVWGSYQTLAVTYAAEVAPVPLRLYLTTYINVCWVFGQLISSGVIKGISTMSNPDSYKIAFGLQWMWPIPLLIGVFLAPESPWFLVKKGRLKEAERSVTRLLSMPEKQLVAENIVTKIQLTVKEESAIDSTGSIVDCFKGSNLRRTHIACVTWLIQSITGATMMGYSTYFYQQAGLAQSMSFTFSIIQYALGIVGTLGSWFISRKFGRFTIYIYGLCMMFVCLMITGGMGVSTSTSAKWGAGSMLLVYTFFYDLTIGPLCYCIVAEMPSARLRARTVMLARNCYNIGNIVVGIVTPYMLNPTAWNLGAKSSFVWAVICFISIIWCYCFLPETKGKTFAELDVLFRDKVGARKFKSTEVEVFSAGEMMEKMDGDQIKDMLKEREHVEHVDIEK
ncbi:unnamed protein product [Candida verbasci]|uniref:Major facilitator superfamily (MFS) profile domain-containing protein n=1 Tax=Candida verbasci TaxID=1227364 RepID=A0A9W4TXA7_9ASCO|nr:unnamed protein product [Candida verbasci]